MNEFYKLSHYYISVLKQSFIIRIINLKKASLKKRSLLKYILSKSGVNYFVFAKNSLTESL